MRGLRRFASRIRDFVRGRRDPGLADELKAHLELLTDENIRAGMEPAQARRQARLTLGGLSSVQEECYEQQGLPQLETFLKDLRYAARSLRKAPTFTGAATLTLALAIGANTAIFSLVDQALLHPRGVVHPQRVVSIRERYGRIKLNDIPISAPAFADVRAARNLFQYAAAASGVDLTYTGGRDPRHLRAATVSSDWFDVLGARPILGRAFNEREDQPNANRVAVLSYSTWTGTFGGDPSIVHRAVELDRLPYRVLGVMGPDFDWPQRSDLWIPLALPPAAFEAKNRFSENLFAIARLRPGVSPEQANAWLKLLGARVLSSNVPGATEVSRMDWGMFLESFTRVTAGDIRTPILLLLASVGIVLLIAWFNIAGLILARNAARSHEFAIQVALGASRARLLSRTLAETLLLVALGSASGVALAAAAIPALLRWVPAGSALGLGARIDWLTLGFTGALAILSALFFGILPARQASGAEPFGAMKAGARITGRQRLRSALVVAEAALALTLIIAAAALLRSFRTLETVRPGFEPHGVTTATISFPRTQYPTAAKQSLFYRQLLQRLPPASGVVLGAPFTGFQSSSGLEIQGRPFPRDASAIPHGDYRLVTPGFFEALRIPLLRGRLFDVGDRKESEPVAVVDQTIADRFWPGEDPIGKRLRPADGGPWYTIIGISGHVLQSSLANDSGRGMVYYDLYQTAGPIPFATIVTRAPVDAVRAAVAGADPAESIFDIQNLEARVAASLAARGFVLRIMSFFAAVALFLAALGLYGVISFAVNRRTREIGVRVALGARSATVSYMVVGEGLRLVAFGAVLGLALSAALARTLEAQLYHVRPLDFGAVFLAVALLFAVAAAASLFPARRAASVDPVAALRCE